MDRHPNGDLIQRAAAMGLSSMSVSADLAAALHPKSNIILTDRMLSNSRQYLHAIVAEIETKICKVAVENFGVAHENIIEIAASGKDHSYRLLQDADMLGDRQILDHVFLQAQQTELTVRLLQKMSQADLEGILTRYLDHKDPAIAEAAMGLLVAQGRSGADAGQVSAAMSDLPAETLSAFVWSIVAAIQKISGYHGPELPKAAQRMLGEHDESVSANSRAQRLAGLLEQRAENSNHRPHPLEDGIQLFIARMARRSGLSSDQITLFTAEPNMVRLVVVMRSLNISVDDALSIFAGLDGGGNMLTAASYKEVDQDDALALVAKWSTNDALQDAQRRLLSNGID